MDPLRARWTPLFAACLGLFLACSRAGESPMPLPRDVPPAGDGFDLALFQSTGNPMQGGHSLGLILNGSIFSALEGAIHEAKSNIHMVVYIWRPSAPSDRVINAIASRTREGVACRIMVDPVGSTPEFQKEVRPRLLAAKCDVKTFRPLKRGAVGASAGRNHRKILVVDGRVGITGGFGIYKSWLGDGLKEEEWRDTHVRVRGPAVRSMQVAFAENWQEAGGALLGPEAFPAPQEEGTSRAVFIASSVEVGPSNADRTTQLLVASARKRLWISNAYFVPPDNLLELIGRKRREGVDVQILAAGPIHDVKPVLTAQRATYEKLLEAGVKVWEYQPSMMHAKTMVVDDRLAVVGSTNLDPLSLNRLEEGSLVMDDAGVNAELAKLFEADLRHSKAIRPGADEIPGLWGRVSMAAFRLIGEGPGR